VVLKVGVRREDAVTFFAVVMSALFMRKEGPLSLEDMVAAAAYIVIEFSVF